MLNRPFVTRHFVGSIVLFAIFNWNEVERCAHLNYYNFIRNSFDYTEKHLVEI